MANADTRNKYAVVEVAGVALTQQPASTNPIASGDTGVYRDNNDVLQFVSASQTSAIPSKQFVFQNGIIPAARLPIGTNPADTETITIGTHVFEIDTATPPVATLATSTAIFKEATVALTITNIIGAINGTAAAAKVTPGSTPFSLSVVADLVATNVIRIRKASAQGGTAIAGTFATTSLAETMGDAGNGPWDCANLNVSGKAASAANITTGSLTITAAMITAAAFNVELPFTPTSLVWQGTASTGVPRAINEAVTISGNAIHLVFAGGASPNWQAGDLFNFTAVA